MPAVAPPCLGAVRPSVGAGAGPRRGERTQRQPWRAEHEGRPRRGEGVISGQEAEAGSRWGGGGSHAAPRGGRGQRPGRAQRTAGFGPDPGLRPTRASRPRLRPRLCLRGPGASLPSSLRPLLRGNSAAPNLGKSFPTSDRPGEARQPPSLDSQLFLSAPNFGSQAALGPEPSPELPCPLVRPPTLFPAWPAGPGGPLPAAADRPGFPPRGGGSS